MTQETILGDYKIIKQLGQGPTGAVYLAEHRFIKRQYLLKALPQELSQDRAFLQRFEEEVAKLAALDHPHLVKVHNISFAEGTYFLVTDCVVDSIGETTNLAQYMAGRQERLREEELLSVSRQIASALDYLHEKGLCHLGLKLNNILIGKGKPGIDIFLSDMALSKILHPGMIVARCFHATCEALEAFPVEMSKEGKLCYPSHPVAAEKLPKLSQSFLQSFAFLAPEQKRMESATLAADAYAFGVLVYYLILGDFPEGRYRSIQEQVRLYQYDWDHVLQQCLSTAPDDRPLKLLPLLGHKLGTLHSTGIALDLTPRNLPHIEPEISAPIEIAAQMPAPVTPVQVEAPEIKTPEPEVLVAAEPVVPEPVALPRITPPARLQPVIQRQMITQPISAAPVACATMELAPKRDLSEATADVSSLLEQSAPKRSLEDLLAREPVVKEYQPEQKNAAFDDPIATEMVVIPGGRYLRGGQEGSRDEAPAHMIEIRDFAIDIHPVTNEQFVRFLNFMGGEKDQNYNDLIRLKDSRINRAAGKLSIESGYGKHPVVGVTWYGAVAYAQWIGKRLPTEAEWEVAARGGLENCAYPTGKNIEKTMANFFSSDTTPVMSYAANPYGIYDLAGNVYEWCQDWYGYNYYETTAQEPQDPKGPLQGVYRVLRGGCWKSLKEDLRCAHRHRNNPGTVNGTYGFRCAADVQEI